MVCGAFTQGATCASSADIVLMCGIAGFLNSRIASSAELLRMTALRMGGALQHRGPDDQGAWFDEDAGIAFAHQRLSILDLSSAGHQPMVSADGRFVISFNGEIYNHLAVRRELEHSGRAPVWRGHSDTETMLAAFVAWGPLQALQRFRGMFAFALWDRKLRCLYLARDRIGEKPLYYGWLGHTFAFGSELKALRRHPEWRGEIDRGALCLFMRHNYVPAPYSIYSGVYKLLPGNLLRLDPGAREPEIVPYWSAAATIGDAVGNPFNEGAAAAVERLEEVLRATIAEQMIADVPLGAFLSGGIDSSTIVALMQVQSSRPVRTFSIGFHEQAYDEAIYAKAVARYLGTDHTELYVSSQQAREVIPRLPYLYDEPFADSSQIPTFLVAQLARQHVTVALSGDGGDELFAGYTRYIEVDARFRRQKTIPMPVRRAIALAITAMPLAQLDGALQFLSRTKPFGWLGADPVERLRNLAVLLDLDQPEGLYRRLVSYCVEPDALVLGGDEPPTALTDRARQVRLDDFIQLMMSIDLVSYLPDDILVKVDRAAMAVGLETRVPLLDHRVIQFAWSLPQDLKLRDGESKWILRQLLFKHVPRELLERPKMGFGVPIGAWLRGPLRDWAEALLDEKLLCSQGFFNPELVRRNWQRLLAGTADVEGLTWSILMFQAWLGAAADVTAAELVA